MNTLPSTSTMIPLAHMRQIDRHLPKQAPFLEHDDVDMWDERNIMLAVTDDGDSRYEHSTYIVTTTQNLADDRWMNVYMTHHKVVVSYDKVEDTYDSTCRVASHTQLTHL